MSINPTLKNEQLAAYLATDDSVRALEKAVENGQTRLALQVVLDLISELTERVMDLEDTIHPADDTISSEDNALENIEAKDPVLKEESVQPFIKEETKKDDTPATEKVENNKAKSEEIKISK